MAPYATDRPRTARAGVPPGPGLMGLALAARRPPGGDGPGADQAGKLAVGDHRHLAGQARAFQGEDELGGRAHARRPGGALAAQHHDLARADLAAADGVIRYTSAPHSASAATASRRCG